MITVDSARIDAAGAVQFKDQMRELTAGTGHRVVLDLTQVGFVDSSGLGAIIASMKHLAPCCTLELASLSPTVEKVFQLTRMDSVFTIHKSTASIFARSHKTG